MSLIYNKTAWKDDKSTPVNANNLNNIEDGIEYIYYKWDKIIGDSTTGDHAAELIDARYSPFYSEQHPTVGHRLNHMDELMYLLINGRTIDGGNLGDDGIRNIYDGGEL